MGLKQEFYFVIRNTVRQTQQNLTNSPCTHLIWKKQKTQTGKGTCPRPHQKVPGPGEGLFHVQLWV